MIVILLFIILRGRFETTYFDLKIKAVIIEDNVIFLKSPNPHLGVFFPFSYVSIQCSRRRSIYKSCTHA